MKGLPSDSRHAVPRESERPTLSLTPDSVIEQLEELEEKYLMDFMDQNRFCREGEKYLETHDGWVQFQIHPGRSEEEGRTMRHCGNVPSWTFGDYIYSLREPIEKNGEVFWKPHISITCNGLEFKEIKGFSNRKPPKDLHPHILDLLCQKNFVVLAKRGTDLRMIFMFATFHCLTFANFTPVIHLFNRII